MNMNINRVNAAHSCFFNFELNLMLMRHLFSQSRRLKICVLEIGDKTEINLLCKKIVCNINFENLPIGS